MEQSEINKYCGWCEKYNTQECNELFVQPDKEDFCENYEYGLPFNND